MMEDISPILDVIRTLRGKNGCPWDQKQTPVTLWKCLAEELYELEEGLVKGDLENTCEELGDVLFLVLFVMEIFHDSGKIPFSRVVDTVTQKMIRRHPHVYGDTRIENTGQLMDQWERIKAREKVQKKTRNSGKNSSENLNGENSSAMDKVPQGMPGLLRAMKVSKEAVKQGFDWDDMDGVLDQTRDEIKEFTEALESGSREDAMMEFGDILFSLVNVARFAGFHPEMALSAATAKFEKRFRCMEKLLEEQDVELKTLSQKEKDVFWNRAKEETK